MNEQPEQRLVDLPEWAEEWRKPARYKVAHGGRGGGKAARDDTPIPTPDGFTEIAALRVGDMVFGEDGKPYPVTGVYPQGERPLLRVVFSDGSDLFVDEEHLWCVMTHQHRKQASREGVDIGRMGDWRAQLPWTTKEMRGALTQGKRGDRNLAIPAAQPLELPDVALPIDPYVLGLWLGDGTAREPEITATPPDAAFYGQHAAAIGYPWKQRGDNNGNMRCSMTGDGFMRRALRELGVTNNKHIPQAYLRASYRQRLALLRGLMDTDGTIGKDGAHVSFSQSDRRIADQVRELIVSLGWPATITMKPTTHKDNWNVRFRADVVPFALPRKVNRWQAPGAQAARYRQRMITAIEPAGSGSATCITVASPFSLFLAGRSMIPTHNSWGAGGLLVVDGAQRRLRVACVREVQKSIADSSKHVIENWIERAGLQGFYRVTRDWIIGQNGTYFFFRGMSTATEEQIRGLEDVDRVWVEEAQRLSKRSLEILKPTVRKPTSEIWMTFNPRYRSDPVYNDFVVEGRDNAIVTQVNYDANPWFPKELEEERLNCQRYEPHRYPHIWLGQPDDEGDTRILLPYSMIRECVDAHKKVGYEPEGRIDVGLDIADTGADRSALVMRRGPLIENAIRWSAPSLGVTAKRAHDACLRYGARRLYYDGTGIGAGVRSDILRIRSELGSLPYLPQSILFGGKVEGPEYEFARRIKNKDFFAHRNSQLAWTLQLRMRRTMRLLEGEDINPERCLFISSKIPELERYLTQLAQPVWAENLTGKIVIDKAPDNMPSPDLYDATALAFAWDSRSGLRNR